MNLFLETNSCILDKQWIKEKIKARFRFHMRNEEKAQ